MVKITQQYRDELSLTVMRLLVDEPDLSQRQLAARLGISTGATHYCLRALLDKGYLKLENFANSKHKQKYAYILTPSGLRQKLALTRCYLEIKKEEYKLLKAELEALENLSLDLLSAEE